MFMPLSSDRLRPLVSVLVLSLLSVAHISPAAPEAGRSSDSAPAVFTVELDNKGMYSSIQAAIDAAPVGTIIQIGPGLYSESLKIDKAVTLVGTGWKRSTIVSPVDLAETLAQLRLDMDTRMRSAASAEQRRALSVEFKAKAQTLANVDYSLTPGSPAQRAGIGASHPPALLSPWPLQPAELAVIHDSDTRDYRQWQRP